VISKYYTKVTLARLQSLLDLSAKETEEFLSKLVVDKTIYARMDRPAGLVTFVKNRSPNESLNEWRGSVHELLDLIEKTNHLIAKEDMVHSITKVM
jgi:26S proteasome regulatory subunit N5